jgi:hypothetical protein
MDKITELFRIKLEAMCDEYRKKKYLMPSWRLDNSLPIEIREKAIDEKVNYLIEKYKISNPVYLLLKNDFTLLEEKDQIIHTINEFKSLNVDPRYLESIGFDEEQIKVYHEFINNVKAFFKRSTND